MAAISTLHLAFLNYYTSLWNLNASSRSRTSDGVGPRRKQKKQQKNAGLNEPVSIQNRWPDSKTVIDKKHL